MCKIKAEDVKTSRKNNKDEIMLILHLPYHWQGNVVMDDTWMVVYSYYMT